MSHAPQVRLAAGNGEQDGRSSPGELRETQGSLTENDTNYSGTWKADHPVLSESPRES